ncbi:sm snRNP core protein Sme1 [Pyricularia oryzae]|uniref:Small nuclear ribonucleoprotein E n=3 Tax=Pyricularia oryzae TaxID=318829 RepID=A0A4P7N838_PYROR|nr:sm snRNP core protein Sme1 [Pyricularia oryzae Y34]KAI7931719.1 sm snRNP core protein Sme1 [Pyricularia oryzae]KAI7932900.1 sm snRNP core protein Sme1 [Pyricularia oryzae]QBZ56250.1 hypothetical protein PoMZ_01156 [Pyricularia oryzae]
MTGRGGGGGRKILLPPINCIFKLLQSHATVSIWLYEQLGIRIEGKIRGFDEFMNLVIDDAVEVKQITKDNTEEKRRPLAYNRGDCEQQAEEGRTEGQGPHGPSMAAGLGMAHYDWGYGRPAPAGPA